MKITLKDDMLVLEFFPHGTTLAVVRALPSRMFDPVTSTWRVPYTRENWRAMCAQPTVFDLAGIPAPSGTGYSVEVQRGLLKIRTPWSAINAELLRRLPDYRMWDSKA